MSTWNDYFIDIVDTVATKSKDRSRKIGAIIVGPNNGIRSSGYNNFPRGANDDVEERHQRPLKYKWTVHAEQNAIFNAAENGTSTKDCMMVLRWFPCIECSKAIIQSGIKKILCGKPDVNDPVWGEDFRIGLEMLPECGVEISYHCDEIQDGRK